MKARYFITLALSAFCAASGRTGCAAQLDIAGPPGSGQFGTSVVVLPNGNLVVTDPSFSTSNANVGAVYLYNPSGTLISAVTGSSTDDEIGSGGVTVLANGNFVIESWTWNNGVATQAGAVTWVNGNSGLSGTVSEANSLVGTSPNDEVGYSSGGGVFVSPEVGVTALPNGNFVVISPSWSNGGATASGAVTWGNGDLGISGPISAANSLVGSTTGDMVGLRRVTVLINGNYLIGSPKWNNGAATSAGAVTLGDGNVGTSGPISSSNSLVGSHKNDGVGGVVILNNGNFVAGSTGWNGGVGAATWDSGTSGIVGIVSSTNSLTGLAPGDGTGGVVPLHNGNYVVTSLGWNNGSATGAGAVTWGNGNIGVVGTVSAGNSFVGSAAGDSLGSYIFPLSNGNYVIGTPKWNDGVGAETLGNGISGMTGVVSAMNSLTGSTPGDNVGQFIYALANGNFIVSSPYWNNNGATRAGAATWVDGNSGLVGIVSDTNSLVGTSTNDEVGFVTALSNGNYFVVSPSWNNGAATSAGAVTWANGNVGISGPVSSSNSLVGVTTNDSIPYPGGIVELGDGNCVLVSPGWNNGSVAGVGAVTWINGASGLIGAVSASNSLVGTMAEDHIGINSVTALANGNYVVSSSAWSNGGLTQIGAVTWTDRRLGLIGAVSLENSITGSSANDEVGGSGSSNSSARFVAAQSDGNYVFSSPHWNNGGITRAGAVTLGSGRFRLKGTIQKWNSVLGGAANGGAQMVYAYDATRHQLVIGRPLENIVSLFTMDQIFADDFQ